MPVQLEVRQGQNLLEVIQHLAEDYDIDFAYAPEVLARKQLEPATFAAPDMESLLRHLLDGESVQYHRVSEDRFLLRSLQLKAGPEQEQSIALSGRILDAATGAPMGNVALALDTLNLGGLTDREGYFSFRVPADFRDRSVWIYHIGYASKNVSVSKLAGTKTLRLQAEPLSLDEILIVDQLPRLTLASTEGGVKMQQDAIHGLNASSLAGNDVFRRVQLLAGVSADDDLSTDIRIRGSDADETLIILDGMPLHKIDHFYGVFSALNSNYLEEVHLYKNEFPVQYGGRTGGMLLMRSTDEIKSLSGQADLNLLSAALTMDVPLGKQLGVSVSARSSHTNLADSRFFDWVDRKVDNYFDSEALENRPELLTTNPKFGFSDWNAKLLFKPGNGASLALNFFRSNDNYLNSYYNRFVNTRFTQERVVLEEDFRDQQSWHNTGTSLQYRQDLGREWTLDVEGFFTRYQMEESVSASFSRTIANRGSQASNLENDQFNRLENMGARWWLTNTFDGDHQLKLGASWNGYQTDFHVVSEIDTLLSSQGQSFDLQAFAEYEWKLFDHLQLSAGGRWNYYAQSSDLYFAPRLTARYYLGADLFFKGTYNINFQFIRELTHENRLSQSVDLIVLSGDGRFPQGRSDNLMLGANYKWSNWMVDVEVYHKKLANVLEHSSLIPGFGDNRLRPGTRQSYHVFVGEGTVRGVDVMLGWEYPHYKGHLAYTLSKAVNSFPQIQRGALIPSRDDRRHQLKWVNNWQWGKFSFSANYIYSSGRPYFDQRIINSDRRPDNVRSIPSYQRLDTGIDYNFPIGRTRAKVGLSVFNLTNNANVKYLQFIYSTNAEESNRLINRVIGSQADLLDRTLNLSLGWAF